MGADARLRWTLQLPCLVHARPTVHCNSRKGGPFCLFPGAPPYPLQALRAGPTKGIAGRLKLLQKVIFTQ